MGDFYLPKLVLENRLLRPLFVNLKVVPDVDGYKILGVKDGFGRSLSNKGIQSVSKSGHTLLSPLFRIGRGKHAKKFLS